VAPAREDDDPAGARRPPVAAGAETEGEDLLAGTPPTAQRAVVRRAAPRFRLGAYIRATFEVEDWRRFRLCGMDEVGRGAFAGPLVAAAVVLPPGFRHPWLRDSKKLTAHQREVVAAEVHRRALACAIAEITVAEINLRGLGWANVEIFRRLVAEVAADGYCCDGRLRIDAAHPVHCLVRGDDLIPSISAASIVAKVHRDALMRRLHLQAPDYDWDHNKGYGAPVHRAAILARGVHPEHRRVFIDNLLQLELCLEPAAAPEVRSSGAGVVEPGAGALTGIAGARSAGATELAAAGAPPAPEVAGTRP
jgi:ribonuclease HII